MSVSSLQNGITSLSIGTQQTLSLEPDVYSVDFDNLKSSSQMKFQFYCRTLSNGITYNQYPTTAYNTLIDLYQLKYNATYSSYPLSSINTCFNSLSKNKFSLVN